jgi:hypothetical protein
MVFTDSITKPTSRVIADKLSQSSYLRIILILFYKSMTVRLGDGFAFPFRCRFTASHGEEDENMFSKGN